MKILHVFDHSIPLHSGYTFRSRNILKQQRLLGWETEHLTSPKHNQATRPAGEEEEIDGLRFFRTPWRETAADRLPVLNQWRIVQALERRLDELIPRLRPDILHAHSPVLNGLAVVRAGRRHGLPVVYEIRAFWEDAAVDHGTTREGSLRYRLTRWLETQVINRADAITTICEGLRRDILARGTPADKVTVIPNAVDIGKFQGQGQADPQLARELGLGEGLVLGFIGSFYAYEGLPLLLRAMPAILGQRPDTRLLLVGGGPQENEIRRLVSELNLNEQVILTGRVPHERVQAYYDLVDVFVYPRLSMRLTELVTPLKPLEAMAQRRLVVASDVGGHRELIRHGETGFLFKAGDAGDLAATVLELAAQPEHWPAIKQRGREFVDQQRNWPASVARYQNVYARLAGDE